MNARRNLLNNMLELAHETDANGSGVPQGAHQRDCCIDPGGDFGGDA
jgi:hypothetical protein